MKRMLAVVAFVGLLVISGYADELVMKANVPFSFVAGQKTFPAGNYEFRATTDLDTIQVRNLDTGATAEVNVMTRLAQEPIDASKAKVTFDEVSGKKPELEAVWPGSDDGYLVGITKEKHKHRSVKLTKVV